MEPKSSGIHPETGEDAPPKGGPAHSSGRYEFLGIDLAGLDCLVVGGGRVGTRKALHLARGGANVTVAAPEASPRLEGAAARGEVVLAKRPYSPELLQGRFLVVAATNAPRLNLRIRNDCEKRGILCCTASPGRGSRVIFPAVYHGEVVTVAVHSHGSDCGRSAETRNKIALILEQPDTVQEEVHVYGMERGSVPEDFFLRISSLGELPDGEPAPPPLREAAVLATCWRWECWFVSHSAEAGAREIRRRIADRSGLLPEAFGEAFYLKSGPAAHLHMIETACGLKSPLPGERDIAGQVRRIRRRLRPMSHPRLVRLLDRILEKQRTIRRRSGLVESAPDWTDNILYSLRRMSGRQGPSKVAVAGLGKMGSALAARLRREGMEVIPVSRRGGEAMRGALKPGTVPESLDAAVITSDLPELSRQLTTRGVPVLDITSSEGLRECLTRTLSPRLSEKLALAGRLAFEEVLKQAPVSPMKRALRLGARPSRLSLKQADEAIRFMSIVMPGAGFEVVPVASPGDRDKETPIDLVSEEDFFTRDIDEQLLEGGIDIAVHSTKDLPSSLRTGLTVAALLPAFAPWECLVSRTGQGLFALPAGAIVGVSCARRRRWLAYKRPDLIAKDIRGDVPDRLHQMDERRFDALLLAAAGLLRLGLGHRIAEVYTAEEFPPPPGQGALALVVREGDEGLLRALAPLDLGDRKEMPWHSDA